MTDEWHIFKMGMLWSLYWNRVQAPLWSSSGPKLLMLTRFMNACQVMSFIAWVTIITNNHCRHAMFMSRLDNELANCVVSKTVNMKWLWLLKNNVVYQSCVKLQIFHGGWIPCCHTILHHCIMGRNVHNWANCNLTPGYKYMTCLSLLSHACIINKRQTHEWKSEQIVMHMHIHSFYN